MSRFINYNNGEGLTLTEFAAYAETDIQDFVDSVQRDISQSAPLDGALAALEDGSLWADDQQPLIEEIHALITEHERTAMPNDLTPEEWEREVRSRATADEIEYYDNQ